MNKACKSVVVVALTCVGSFGARAEVRSGGDVSAFNDPAHDSVVRRTNFGGGGVLNPEGILPDLLGIDVAGWAPLHPAVDPYVGTTVDPEGANIFRLQVVFNGLVNPPGTLGSGGAIFDPYLYGPSPVYGYVEFDVDGSKDTGGELWGPATNRFLANVGRFGARPHDSVGARAARSGYNQDHDWDFYTTPQYERSGQDFSLVLCGCGAATVVCEVGDEDGVFEAGEMWIVRNRFFQRAGGYQGASRVFGGSAPQLYDPWVNLRFEHSLATDRTTITLVYALDMVGAALLAGEPEQNEDLRIDAGNHSSVREALQDIIAGAKGEYGQLFGPVRVLAEHWEDRDVDQALRVNRWDVTAIFGTVLTTDEDGVIVWTDAGFELLVGDLNGDRVLGDLDLEIFDCELTSLDGCPHDEDGEVNGEFHVRDFAANFNRLDFNYDGVVNGEDRKVLEPPPPVCRADWNEDDFVNSQDFFDFLMGFFANNADFNEDGFTNSQDFFDFLVAFFEGC